MRRVKMCGLNNWKDELPFMEIQGGEVLPWCLGDDQRSVSSMLGLSCSSRIPGRAVEPAAGSAHMGCMMPSCGLTSGCLFVRWMALRGGQGKGFAVCACRARTCTCYFPGQGFLCLRPPGNSQDRKGWRWLGAPGPGTEMGTEAHVTCLGQQGKAAELEPRPLMQGSDLCMAR